ncbi:MAG: glycoside hydrolase family 2 TIM barrel-domain containing protein [Mariniphaga sp.]|nr:glycoside hydrolase family 2 TIM barrel-domain containing protein [Mariniphaga sp.]MDD4226698.1 glycoside hydrolase family 2 TIM barrel-domain containing protein [Mariniphaga sp.]MDD4425738.1 glycoside hydrolase family 2 TIM barrel-domain containing protein [Mariniphaga sp.]
MKQNNNISKLFIRIKHFVFPCLIAGLACLFSFTGKAGEKSLSSSKKVEIKPEEGKFNLYKEGEPYFIKGAVGWDFLEELTHSGANSLRTSPRLLDEAQRLGLTVLVNLPVASERSGFDYNNREAVQKQLDRVIKMVKEYKNHPAVLMWAIGNELDHIPGDKDYNLKMWDAVNEIAAKIKKIDPDHPVMTITGTGKMDKLKDIKERCPNLDLLGINAYADIVDIPEWLREYDWKKPYVVTEWGPSGWWQVPRNKQGVVIEETSTEKARVYRERYEKVILGDPLCLGSYVFLWTSNRQERTHTWFNMFHNNLKTQTVEVMQYMWTGTWPENLTPRIEKLTINQKKALDPIELSPESINIATVIASDPDQDDLTMEWELLPEPEKFGAYAGQGEVKPTPMENFILARQDHSIQFKITDTKSKNYRLFVYVYDGKGNVGVANVPFFVNGD